MLRPATPLAVVLFAAFALLVLSVLSTPVVKAIPLGSFDGNTFGVFGFCKADGSCSDFGLGYDASSVSSANSFDLPTSTRNTLSTILVLHPVAAFLCLVMLAMAIAAHFHAPAHSIRYLLFVVIVSIFAFLSALLAFLIDVLYFVPHLAWGSYVTLAAACLIGVGSIFACAMRRTLVSRKSRQRRIEANAEMSGENFYNRQAQGPAALTATTTTVITSPAAEMPSPSREPTMPQLDRKDAASSDEQIPLTAQTTQSGEPQYGYVSRRMSGDPMAMSGAATGPPPRPNRPPSVQRDAYGNILPYQSSQTPPPDGYGIRGASSFDRMNNASPSQRGRGNRPPGGYRGGRGGGPMLYGPPGRGGYGPPPGRGNYGPPGRGGYGGGGPMPPYNGRGRGAYGGYGPPPGRGGYPGPGRGGRSPSPGYRYDGAGSYGNGSRGPSPGPLGPQGGGGYYANSSMPNLNSGYAANGEVDYASDLPRAESPPPLPASAGGLPNQAAPGLESTPVPLLSQKQGTGQFGDGDDDIAGMVGLQQGRTSRGVDGQYAPARSNWQVGQAGPTGPNGRGLPQVNESVRQSTSDYVEDVDPRFAEPQNQTRRSSLPLQPALQLPIINHPYDDIPQGARSPAESEHSTFTSISQRGINPRWNPPGQPMMPNYGPGGPPGHMIARRPLNDKNDVLLNTNPDFSLPVMGRQGGRGGPRGLNMGAASNGGMIPGSAYPAL